MFFSFFLWGGLFFLVERFEYQTEVWMPESSVWTLKAVTDTSYVLDYVLERPRQICGLLGPFAQQLLAFGMGLQKRQWINSHRPRSQLKSRPICWTTDGECWLSHFREKLLKQILVLVMPTVIKWSGCLLCWGKCKNIDIIQIYIYKRCAYSFKLFQCSDCVIVKEICSRKAKFRTVLCLRTLGCLLVTPSGNKNRSETTNVSLDLKPVLFWGTFERTLLFKNI